MLNKFTLRFNSEIFDQIYRTQQKVTIEKDFQSYCFQISFVTVLLIIKNIQLSQTLFAIFEIIFLILQYLAYILICRYECADRIVFPIIQICIAISKSLHDNVTLQNEWIVGFIVCFFHYSLFLQGSCLIPQLFILLFIFIYYELVSISYTIYSVLMLLAILISMYVSARKKECNSKIQFIQQYEHNKWFQIVEDALKNAIVLIKFNKQTNLIEIERSSILIQKQYNIKDSQDLRTFFRQIKLNDKSISLEALLNYGLQGQGEQLEDHVIGQIEATAENFNIRLLEHFKEDQKLIIVMIEKLKLTKTKPSLYQPAQKIFYTCLVELDHVAKQLGQILSNHKLLPKLMTKMHVQLQTLVLLFKPKIILQFQTFNLNDLVTSLARQTNIHFQRSLADIILVNSHQAIFFLLYNLIEFLKRLGSDQLQIQIIPQSEQFTNIRIKFNKNVDQILDILNQPVVYSNIFTDESSNEKCHKRLVEEILKLSDILEISNPSSAALLFCMTKYLLTLVGVTNNIEFKSLSLTISLANYSP